MDCLICYKNVSAEISQNPSTFAESICKLLELPTSPEIEEIFVNSILCPICQNKLKEFNQKWAQFKQLEESLLEIRMGIWDELNKSADMSSTMRIYGGAMSSSSLTRIKLFQAIAYPDQDPPPEDSSEEFIDLVCPIKMTEKFEISEQIEIKEHITLFEASPKEDQEQKQKVAKSGRRKLKYFGANKIKQKKKEKECSICGNSFFDNYSLKRHQLIHGPKKFKCPRANCGQKYHRKDHLEKHMARMHPEPSNGKNCKNPTINSTPTSSGKPPPRKTNDPAKLYECFHCSKRFPSNSSILMHLGDEKPTHCGICQEKLASLGCLNHHLTIAHGISSRGNPKNKITSINRGNFSFVKCSQCQKSFSSENNLKMHKIIHDSKKKWTCPIPGCTKSFKTKYSLKSHSLLSHSKGNFRYECTFPGCGRKLSSKSYLKYHQKGHEIALKK